MARSLLYRESDDAVLVGRPDHLHRPEHDREAAGRPVELEELARLRQPERLGPLTLDRDRAFDYRSSVHHPVLGGVTVGHRLIRDPGPLQQHLAWLTDEAEEVRIIVWLREHLLEVVLPGRSI